MPCYSPIRGYRNRDGTIRLRAPVLGEELLELACSSCIGCRVERARQWAIRCMHEAQMHEHNSFITLTYRNADLPLNGNLEKSDFQKFAKRLRRKGIKFRYLMCGEYGEKHFRCHFHSAIFGHDFNTDPGTELVSRNDLGQPLYRSPLLEAVWGLGNTMSGALTFESARYVAQYLTKTNNEEWESIKLGAATDSDGNAIPFQRPYATASRKPGLGRAWIEKYYTDVYPHDEVILDGHRCKPPKYYDLVAEQKDPEFMAGLKLKRIARAELCSDNSPARLAQRKEYQEIKLTQSRSSS